ncbi:unnamed protein product [Ilex paraguariensis]|uniref:Pentatricopeptide repeat-containing protein n=1 Tax=Ilex paraguariensis TaxID=185542 RepID=A0ABC8TED5_9AQUA
MKHNLRLTLRHHHRRGFATKYSGRVVVETENGRSFEVQVDAPNLQADVRGYLLPRRDLICKITQILHSQSSDPFLDLSDYLENLSLTFSPSEASEILKSLKSPTLALRFFQFCPSNVPNFRHNSFTYNRILLILSKSSSPHKFDTVRRIITEMEKSNLRGSISTVNILIGIFGGGEEGVEELERCLRLVKQWDLRLNCYTYKCLLQAYLRSNDSNKALEVYREMRMKGYKLDIFAYNMLLDALAKDEKDGRTAEAVDLYAKLKQQGLTPDSITYAVLERLQSGSHRTVRVRRQSPITGWVVSPLR